METRKVLIDLYEHLKYKDNFITHDELIHACDDLVINHYYEVYEYLYNNTDDLSLVILLGGYNGQKQYLIHKYYKDMYNVYIY